MDDPSAVRRPRRNNDPAPAQVTAAMSQACPRHVVRAVAYLREHMAGKVSLADLAAASGASERTLRRNFPRFLGHSPLAYLRRLRLACVRNALLRGEDTVSVVAARYGLAHFGRFAIAYREAFDETPSATCRRVRHVSQDVGGEHRRWTVARPALVVAVSGAANCGREMNLFATDLGEQLAAALGRMPFVAAAHELSARERRPARFVLTLRAMSEAGLMRVVARLVAADDGRHLWTETFNGASDAMLALQDRIVTAVIETARPAILAAEIAAARDKPPGAQNDRDIVLAALPAALSPDPSGRVLDALYRAMALYPADGLAVALAAWCHAQRVTPWNENAARDKAIALTLAGRASVLSQTDPLVLTARAAVMTMAEDFDTADILLRRALAYDPDCYWAWERRGWLRALNRHSDDAIADFEQALRLMGSASDGASSLFGIGTAHWCHRNYDASLVWVDRAATRRPNAPGIQAQLAGCYIVGGEHARGRAVLTALMRERPELTAGHLFGAFWFDKPCPSVAHVLRDAGLNA